MNPKLLDERPLFVLPSLAAAVGLNEAIVLQALHFALGRDSALIEEDRRWMKISLPDWQRQLPFWSERTIRRALQTLKTDGLILTNRGRESNVYAIEYDALAVKVAGAERPDWPVEGGQDGRSPSMKGEKRESKDEREQTVASATDDGPGGHLPGLAPPPPPTVPNSTGGPVVEIWEHFIATFPDVRNNLTASRIRVIEKALKETDDLELLKRAISGLKEWRRTHKGETSLSTIFTTRPGGSALADQIQWWADQAGTALARPGFPSADPVMVRQNKLAVIAGHDSESPEAQERAAEAARWLKEHTGEMAVFNDQAREGEPRVQWTAAA